jgi:hypothetical protein
MEDLTAITEGPRLERLDPPFHERIYTVKEVAEIWGISENHATKLLEGEPGVRDLAPVKHFGRRKRQLRIPHSVLTRVWNRAEVKPQAQVRRTTSSS